MGELTRRDLFLAAGGVLLTAAARSRGLPAMVDIPAGPFLKGTTPERAAALADKLGYHPSWLSGEVPQQSIDVPAFRIDRFPVTVAEYLAFCEATGHRRPPRSPHTRPDHPVTGVDYADATAYAAWAGKLLPTEAQWEKAARGPEGQEYPWGDVFDPEACCWNRAPDGGPRPVTAHPAGASPYGVMDMVGNVAEWCRDKPAPPAAYIKGGSWMTTSPLNLRPAARNMSGWANNALGFYGFRCVEEAT